ncbi:unnamed protein product [Arctia plantaginis]|uniref:C2H2-type domain-containing protein n=1 Tax=Arctia plantaginis TaxID=874455 RepID=A0A8S0YLP8_ARCPL|nr:unnamed protein product [Arctia plantaginis]
MAETSTMNPDNKVEQSEKQKNMQQIKTEVELMVKHEPLECVVCMSRSLECLDIYATHTSASGTTLHNFLTKFTHFNFTSAQNCTKFICKTCYELINVLEQAEIEYIKLKETFEAILSKNPIFALPVAQPIRLNAVKAEVEPDDDDDDEDYVCDSINQDDSDDEPLASQSKRKRQKVEKKKKRLSTVNKRRTRTKISGSWKCDECGTTGSEGGAVALAAHKLSSHLLDDSNTLLQDVKTEDSGEGSQSPLFNNGFENGLKIEMKEQLNDDDSLPETAGFLDLKNNRNKMLANRSKTKTIQVRKKKVKVMHQCDQCDAQYSSKARLEQHKMKHDGSKPPYICEVCGAHYKHKRACDIHIALHKGISDWKCEECNKLFPSKNALQRHNNIHTGKLNYQCDLCGKSFIHTSSFKMHKLSHSGVKPHACDVCGLALMTRSHLKRHKRVHSGEKRHECPVCGKRFSERYNLAAHSKSHESPGEAAGVAAPAPRELVQRRLFRCTFCVERFERRYMLERHMSVVHGRTLERPPPTPRNTMSKLLKAQAQRRDQPPSSEVDTKDDLSSDSRTPTTPITPQKLIAQLASSTSVIAQGAWSGSYAEFGAALRHDFPH